MSDVNQVEEQDILEKFRTAVRNGQTRLALEALVDVVDAIVEIIAPSEEASQVEQPVQPEVVEEKPAVKKKTKESKEDQSVITATE